MIIDPKKTYYLFDVDGTLTEPRKKISASFMNQFLDWSIDKQLFIGTGSDFYKIKQQLPEEFLKRFKLIFCCMGNETRNSEGTVLFKNNFKNSLKLEDDLENFLNNSEFHTKTGRHLEYRTGMVNYSIVGRNASTGERKAYNEWDKSHRERERIKTYINNNYSEYEASIGGSISIDIIMKNKDKGQIVNYIQNLGVKKLVFLGDKCTLGGNDYGVIRELNKSNLAFEWYQVTGPGHVLDLIKNNKVFS